MDWKLFALSIEVLWLVTVRVARTLNSRSFLKRTPSGSRFRVHNWCWPFMGMGFARGKIERSFYKINSSLKVSDFSLVACDCITVFISNKCSMLSRELVTWQQIIIHFPRFLINIVVMWLIHMTALGLYRWWRLCNTVKSYKSKILDFETRIYFVNFVYQSQEWTFMELKRVLSLPALSRALSTLPRLYGNRASIIVNW